MYFSSCFQLCLCRIKYSFGYIEKETFIVFILDILKEEGLNFSSMHWVACMWDHFTFSLSGIRCHRKYDTGAHLQHLKAISPAVAPIFSDMGEHFIYWKAGFRQYWLTERGVKTPSAVSDSKGKADQKNLLAPTLKADRKRSKSQNKHTSPMFCLALQLNFFAI